MLRPVGKFYFDYNRMAAFSTTALAQSNLTAKANVFSLLRPSRWRVIVFETGCLGLCAE